jgi:hypothetical protein
MLWRAAWKGSTQARCNRARGAGVARGVRECVRFEHVRGGSVHVRLREGAGCGHAARTQAEEREEEVVQRGVGRLGVRGEVVDRHVRRVCELGLLRAQSADPWQPWRATDAGVDDSLEVIQLQARVLACGVERDRVAHRCTLLRSSVPPCLSGGRGRDISVTDLTASRQNCMRIIPSSGFDTASYTDASSTCAYICQPPRRGEHVQRDL